jgi:hypothetical protein
LSNDERLGAVITELAGACQRALRDREEPRTAPASCAGRINVRPTSVGAYWMKYCFEWALGRVEFLLAILVLLLYLLLVGVAWELSVARAYMGGAP